MATITMDDLLAGQEEKGLTQGEVVQGTILSVRKHEVLVDLGPLGIGYVPRREVGFSRNLTEGDDVTASVVETELENGYALLSLRKAAKDRSWEELQRIITDGDIIEVRPFDANRGGLLIEFDGVRGFLPVSQLSAEHYPRVGSQDKDEIVQRLGTLVGQTMKVRILDADRKTNKLIFSEKEAVKEGLARRFEELKVGTDVTGTVTGIVDFGVFVNVEGIEGLVHISEVSWQRVNNLGDFVKVGDKVNAKIISIDKDRLSLSIKQTTEDPWLSEVSTFKPGDEVEGTITRITPFGAFVQISPSIEALVHVSELGKTSDADPEKVFTLNERKTFYILEIDKENRKISMSLRPSKNSKPSA
jgi:small subunit ribosomal protein S1